MRFFPGPQGLCVRKICFWCGPTSAPEFTEPSLPLQIAFPFRGRCPRRGRMRETALIMWAVRFPWAAEGGGPYRRGRLIPRREAQGPPLPKLRTVFS